MFQSSEAKQTISIVNPHVLSMPIQENNEPLIDLKDQNQILFGPSPEIPNNMEYTKIRRTVYEKLLEAQNTLSNNLRFCIYEGYRSLQLQEKLFNDRYSFLKQAHPDWKHKELFQETTKMVSPVINLDGSRNIPPHSTGAAIDIYLVNLQCEIVEMGINVADWMQDIDGSISQTNSITISDKAKEHRLIMSRALNDVGFINYPGEYWHWSYGDRYWAYHRGMPFAFYNTVE